MKVLNQLCRSDYFTVSGEEVKAEMGGAYHGCSSPDWSILLSTQNDPSVQATIYKGYQTTPLYSLLQLESKILQT